MTVLHLSRPSYVSHFLTYPLPYTRDFAYSWGAVLPVVNQVKSFGLAFFLIDEDGMTGYTLTRPLVPFPQDGKYLAYDERLS